MMGWSSGFCLEVMGGSMSRGRRRWAWETLAWTSWRARSTSRESSISTVMLHEPCRALEVSVRTPSTWMRASSRVSTTSFSMTSGAAPSQVAETLMVGKSTSGNWLMPIRPPATTPKTTVAAMSIQARTGFLTQASVRFMATRPYFATGAAAAPAGAPTRTGTPFERASAPRTTSVSPPLSPDRTSTRPSAERMPKVRIRSTALSPSTT